LLFQKRKHFLKLLFTQSKRSTSVNKSFLKKRKMDADFASTNSSSAVWADLTKQIYKQFPKGLLLCTSSLSVLISVLILSNSTLNSKI